MIHSISLATLDKGLEPFVFAPWIKGQNNKLKLPYEVIRFRRFSSKRFLRQVLLSLLWHHFKSPFHILHCHCVYPPGDIGALFSRITGVPCVTTTHGADVQLTTEGYVSNRKITEKIRKSIGSAHALTASADNVKERLIFLGAEKEKIHIIPNGVFSSQFRPPTKQKNGKELNYILYLGRVHAIKELDVLLNAFSKLKDRKVRLKIAGEGISETKRLIKLASDLEISNRVDFIGNVRGSEKIELLQKALFFVSPRIINNLGLANLEALASGIPVITTRIAASQKIIKDGENGFLVKESDPIELATKMDLLLSDEDLRNRMSEKALATASFFDWNSIANNYMHIYKSLIDTKFATIL